MNPLETGIEELNELSKKPSAELLEKFFLKRTAAWAYPVIDIGCASVGVCNGLVSALKPESAFNLLVDSAKILIKQKDSNKVEQALDMLSDLVTASETTEMPLGFELLIEDIELKIKDTKSSLGVWNYVKRHYRKT